MSFKKDFVWGAASASYQVEGAYKEDGKGKSVWDEFTSIPDKILFDQNGKVACDHYHRYKEDVSLMRNLSLDAYRFSLSWTRIIPDGMSEINQKGLDFYDRLVDELLKNGIKPYITLYHWDMPYELEKKGGFRNREIVSHFERYADVVTKKLGDRCREFMTLNEPQCNLNLGYYHGVHAPGHKLSIDEAVECMPNMLLSHGAAVEVIRKNVKNSHVGFAACGESVFPVRDDEKLEKLTYESNFAQTSPAAIGWFTDPVCLGKFPKSFMDKYPHILEKVTAEDMARISLPVDYLGFNYYTAEEVDLDENGELKVVTSAAGTPVTAMNWPIREKGLYWMLKFLDRRYKKPIAITENGMANSDYVCLDGKVHDEYRIDYMKRHFAAMEKVTDEGVDLEAYFAWSLMDNFEWSFGFERRFGLVYVDYETQKRTIKESGYWYKNFIENLKK